MELRSKFVNFFTAHTSHALRSLATAAAATVRPLFLGFPLPQMSQLGTSAHSIASSLFVMQPRCSVVPENLFEFREPTSGALALPSCYSAQAQPARRSRGQRPRQTWRREFEDQVMSQLWDWGRRAGIPDEEIKKKIDEIQKMNEFCQKDDSAKLIKEWAQKEKFVQWVASEERKAREEESQRHAEKQRQQAAALPAEVPEASLKDERAVLELPMSELMKQPATVLAMSYHLLVELIVELIEPADRATIQMVVRELGESERWVTSVMEELMLRMEKSAGTTTPNCNNTLLSLLRCCPSDALEEALQRFPLPDQLEHGYIAIMLDAVVMWKASVAQRLNLGDSPIPSEELNKFKLVATPSLLRPILGDASAEFLRQEAIGKGKATHCCQSAVH